MNGKHSWTALLVLALLLAFLATGAASAGGGTGISRGVIGGGGGRTAAGRYVLDSSVGQPVIGAFSAGAYRLCAGFWCGIAGYKIYLPLVLRGA